MNDGFDEGDTHKTDATFPTGTKCEIAGLYFCEEHPSPSPYTQKFVKKGDSFPKCDKKGLSHDTNWVLLDNAEKNAQ